MFNLDKEIERTIKDNNLPFEKVEDVDKDIFIRKLYDTFVTGNPRALWQSLKYSPCTIDCHLEDPYFHLLTVISKDVYLYFIIDCWNNNFTIYKAKMSAIYTFIGDCEGLDEYYLLTTDFMELYCITDHDDLLYIDIRKIAG